MPKQLKIEVKESLSELYALQKSQSSRTLINRIQMLILLKKGDFKYHTELEDALPFKVRTIKDWIKNYKTGGLPTLLVDDRGGNRQAAIVGDVYDEVQSLLQNSNNQITSYVELQAFIADLGVDIKYKALHKFVNQHFNTRLKVGRKSNIKKDEAAVAVFKNDTGCDSSY